MEKKKYKYVLSPEQRAHKIQMLRKYYAEHKEELIKKQKARYHANRDKEREKRREFYKANKEKILARNTKYRHEVQIYKERAQRGKKCALCHVPFGSKIADRRTGKRMVRYCIVCQENPRLMRHVQNILTVRWRNKKLGKPLPPLPGEKKTNEHRQVKNPTIVGQEDQIYRGGQETHEVIVPSGDDHQEHRKGDGGIQENGSVHHLSGEEG